VLLDGVGVASNRASSRDQSEYRLCQTCSLGKKARQEPRDIGKMHHAGKLTEKTGEIPVTLFCQMRRAGTTPEAYRELKPEGRRAI